MAFKDLFNKAKKYVESDEFKEKVNKSKEASKKAFKKSTDHVKKEFEFMKNEFSKKKNTEKDQDSNKEESENTKKENIETNKNTELKKQSEPQDTKYTSEKNDDLTVSIDSIGLTKKQTESLKESGFNTVQDLKNSTTEEIGKVKGIGQAALKKIEDKL